LHAPFRLECDGEAELVLFGFLLDQLGVAIRCKNKQFRVYFSELNIASKTFENFTLAY
jgi:hypothetical protein